MALVLANRVQETATPNTTVSFTLTGAVSGFQTFAVIGNTNTTYYSATDSSGNWEVGEGTYSTSGPTLARTTVYASSNSGSAVTFPGSVNVFVTYPSGKSVNLDASGNVSALGTVSSGTWQGSTIGVAYGGTGVTTSSGPNSVVLRDANENITVNRINQGLQTITASGGTTTLTAASDFNQQLVGTGGHTFRLPDATTLTDTTTFQFNNNASGTLTIQNNAATTVGSVAAGGAAGIALMNNATVGGTWDVHGYVPENITWGTNSLYLASDVITGGIWNGGTIQSGYGGTGLTTFAGANNALYSTSASALAAGTLPVAAGGTGLTTYTLNGVVYASGTGTLATGSALTFNGTNLINSGAYTAPSNGAGAGTKTTIQGSTGTGQAGASGGNGYIELIGGGGTSAWTSFTIGFNQRRRGGINLQAGTAAADAGATYVNGSNIDILGSSGTNNGTLAGNGSRVLIQSGSTTKIDTFTSGGSSINAIGASASVGGSVSMVGGNFTYAAGLTNGSGSISISGGTATQSGQVLVVSGGYIGSGGSNGGATLEASSATVTTGSNIRLRPGLGSISGSTSGKAFVTDPVTVTDYEILTPANITTATITAATANSIPYFGSSQVLTTGSTLTFDGNNLGLGTTPSYKLHVAGPDGSELRWENTADFNRGWRLKATTGVGVNFGTTSGVYPLLFDIDNITRMTLDTSSNLSMVSTGAITSSRINPRTSTAASTATLAPDIQAADQYNLTAQAVGLTVDAPTGIPVDGNKLLFRILDNGSAQTITWNATYTAIGVTLPTATTASKMVYVGCIYNATNTRWDVIAVTTQA